MKTAHLSWEEVKERADGRPITVFYDGIERNGYCLEEHMTKMFQGCELLQLTLNYFQVTKWPERRRRND